MGAKTWMLVYSNGDARSALSVLPQLDRQQSLTFAKKLFPSETLAPLADGAMSWTAPPDDEILVGCFPGVAVVAAKEFGIDRPSELSAHFITGRASKTVHLHAMHSVVDWFACAVWSDGKLQRSLSLSPDSGVIEDVGERLPFEASYWAGEYPAVDPEEDPSDYPFVFHPLELGEATLAEFFGYQLEGTADTTLFDPEQLPLMRFKRQKSLPRRILGRS
jgi:hypothetical protein